jgi:hypothetical protein
VTEKGQKARGYYLNGPTVRALGARDVIRRLRTAKMDAAVIDLKDGQGRVTYDSKIGILQPQERIFLEDASAYVAALRRANIYTIARIVCFSDPELPGRHPERAVLDARPRRKGELWARWGNRNTWLDPYNPANHDLIVNIAREAEELGFDEIQLDYFRFPVDRAARHARYPAETDRPRARVLLDILRRIDREIRIPIGVDVFGVTAFRWKVEQQRELGQVLHAWTKHVEVFTPMLYLNGMGDWMRGLKHGRARRLITVGVRRLRKHLGRGPVIRPFLQAFEQGADYYNARIIAEQILGAREGGADGFLFWHPGSSYRIVRSAMHGRVRDRVPFSIDERIEWRRDDMLDRELPGVPVSTNDDTRNTPEKPAPDDSPDAPPSSGKPVGGSSVAGNIEKVRP